MKREILATLAVCFSTTPADARLRSSHVSADAPRVVKTYNYSSDLPYTALDFFTIDFDVPAGVAEIQVDHMQTAFNSTNILDWGLLGPGGSYRGWGGGNVETAIVGASASSRSYLITGAVETGTWSVLVGKPRVATPPGSYSVNITLLDAPTLAPQTERQPYVPCPPLQSPPEPQWYAGDFHVHSRESGDAFANATHDEIATFAHSQGLDFVHFSEHNTVSTATFLVDAQSRHSDVLLLPGVEYTTYFGHSGALFTTDFVDFRIGWPNVTIKAAADAIHAQGGLMSINHMDMYEGDADGDLRNGCVGCFWDYAGALSSNDIDAVEIAIQSWQGVGFMFSPAAIEWWDHQHALGYTHIAPIGGSDDHHGGQEEQKVGSWDVGSPVGSPTTMVLAANLSHAGIREGVALGRTVVKMFNSQDPMADLKAQVVGSPAPAVRVGGTIVAPASASVRVWLNATVTIPATAANATTSWYVALVRNNEQTFTNPVPSTPGAPFTFTVQVPVPIGGTDRWRAEVHDAATGVMHTITNHIFLPSPAN